MQVMLVSTTQRSLVTEKQALILKRQYFQGPFLNYRQAIPTSIWVPKKDRRWIDPTCWLPVPPKSSILTVTAPQTEFISSSLFTTFSNQGIKPAKLKLEQSVPLSPALGEGWKTLSMGGPLFFKYFLQFKENNGLAALALSVIFAPSQASLDNSYNHAHAPGQHTLPSPGPWSDCRCSKTVDRLWGWLDEWIFLCEGHWI